MAYNYYSFYVLVYPVGSRAYSNMEKDILKERVMIAGVLLCGTVLATCAYDQALMFRHLIWCLITIVLVACTKEIKIGNLHLLMFGYLLFSLLSGVFAVNKSEWLYSTLRIALMLTYLSVVKIDIKLLSKTMILLGIFYIFYFWCEFLGTGNFNALRGLMRQRNYWAAAMFFIIPFCYYAISNGVWKKLAIAVIALTILDILLLGCRSAVVALIVSVIVVLFTEKKYRLYLLFAVIVVTIGLIKFDSTRLLNTVSVKERILQWQPTITMVVENPFGIGNGNWRIMFPEYAGDEISEYFIKKSFNFPHNDFLWVGAETGWCGLICYLGIFLSALYYAYKKKAIYLLIGISGYMTIAFFSNARGRPFASLILVTFLAMSYEGIYKVKRINLTLVILIFTLVVFGFRFRASCWNKELRAANDWQKVEYTTKGYSVFSTLTTVGLPYHWFSGVSNLKIKNYELAHTQFKTALRYNPYNIHVLNNMGISHSIRKEYKQATAYYTKALEICPKYTEASENLKFIKKL